MRIEWHTHEQPVIPEFRHYGDDEERNGWYTLTLTCGDDRVVIFFEDDGETVAEFRQRVFTTPMRIAGE